MYSPLRVPLRRNDYVKYVGSNTAINGRCFFYQQFDDKMCYLYKNLYDVGHPLEAVAKTEACYLILVRRGETAYTATGVLPTSTSTKEQLVRELEAITTAEERTRKTLEELVAKKEALQLAIAALT